MSMQMRAQEMAALRAVAALERQTGLPPTVREVQQWAGMSSSSVASYWLRALRRRGLVEWRSNRTRTLRLTPSGRSVLDLAGVA